MIAPRPSAGDSWNLRYVAYARAHGRTPEEQKRVDDRTRGGNVGFITWITDRICEWQRINGLPVRTTLDHAAFDAWLSNGGGVL